MLNNGKRIKYSKYSVYLGECNEINNSCYSEIWESDFLEWILKYFSNSEGVGVGIVSLIVDKVRVNYGVNAV